MQPYVRRRVPRRTITVPPPVPVPDTVSAINPRLTGCLRDGAGHGLVGGPWVEGLPRYVWHSDGTTVLEFRLDDVVGGRYSACELHPSEWPEGWPT